MTESDIVRRAQMWATGATIHNINGLIGVLRAAWMGMNSTTASSAKKMWAESLAICMCCTIEQYMRHGDYKKAREDNPMPPIYEGTD